MKLNYCSYLEAKKALYCQKSYKNSKYLIFLKYVQIISFIN